jgi:peptidoglycan-N-acetylglucosamine deacetylase
MLALLAACGSKIDHSKPVAGARPAVKKMSKPQPGTPIHYDSSKRYVFLTFDDSPQPPGTNNCKHVFADQGVKATFFLVGMHTEFDPRRHKMLDSLRDGYPETLIANHSYSHGFRNHYRNYYAHPDSAVRDLLRAQALMNVPVKIIRLPGSNAWVGKGENKGPGSTRAVRDKLDSMGYEVIGWDVEWSRKGGQLPRESASEMVREVNYSLDQHKTNTPGAVVILAHDRMFAKQQYADSLARFIAILKQDPRNVFETIDHYPMVQQSQGYPQ